MKDLRTWILRNLQAATGALGELWRAPLASLMSLLVIAIALSLPAGLLVLLDNLERLGARWQGPASLSLYLQAGTSAETAAELARRLEADPAVAAVEPLPPEAGLEELRAIPGFAAALEVLDTNPLPWVLVIHPGPGRDSDAELHRLRAFLAALPEVAQARLDLEWVRRLQRLTELARRAVWLLAGLLGLGVFLILGNTIRLEILNRRAEIEVCKLVGASDAFVRRPFLYRGLWLGGLGGLLAWGLVAAGLWWLQGPALHLAALYESSFRLQPPGPALGLEVAATGALLGWAGAWLAVGRHLGEIEPG